jgi:hypothetical protein
VLARDGDNAKALFRRGRARAALGQTEEAIADLERATKLCVLAWGGGAAAFRAGGSQARAQVARNHHVSLV